MNKIIGFLIQHWRTSLSFIYENKAPQYCYKYLADNKNFPYGIRPASEIVNLVTDLIGEFIEKEKPSIIVVACNTASITALENLRNTYNIPFVGVVPAIKPAAGLSEKGKIGLFATNRTVSESYTADLIDSFAKNCEVLSFADPDIVSFVENRFFFADEKEIIASIQPAADYFVKNGADSIILGCTHFLYLEKYFRKIVPSDVEIIDSREGVINQALRVLENAEDFSSDSCSTFYVSTGDKYSENYKKFAEYFNLEYSGKL